MLCNEYSPFSFSAHWITLPGASSILNCALEFQKEFELSSTALTKEVLLHITAESYYSLEINGHFVGRGPVRGTYSVNFFDTYQIQSLLHLGKNCCRVLIQSMNQCQTFNSHPAGCALLLEIENILISDESWRVRTLPGWNPTTQLFNFQHGYKVDFDLRQANHPIPWIQAALFSSDALSKKALSPRNIPALPAAIATPTLLKQATVSMAPIASAEDITYLLDQEPWAELSAPANITSKQGLAFVYDFHTPRIGFFSLDVTGKNLDGVRLDITYGEELWHGRVRAKYPNPTYFFTDTYKLKEGINHICHPFEMHGAILVQLVFRKIEKQDGSVENSENSQVIVQNFQCEECRYPYGPDTHFSCSDPLLNKIWSLCCETISACTTDLFMDCPWREHAFWVNDLLVENRSSMVMFGPSALHRHAFEVTFSQQHPTGWIPAVVPNPYKEENPPNILPATNFFLFWMLEDYLRESGDFDTVRKYLPQLAIVLETAEATVDESGLVESPKFAWDFWDWAFELNWLMFINSRESMLNHLYLAAMKCYMRLCQLCGIAYDEKKYQTRITRTSQAMKSFLVQDEKSGSLQLEDMVYAVDPKTDAKTPRKIRSELAHALALISNIWPEKEQKGFLQAILGHQLLAPELYLSGLVFQALCEQGGKTGATEALARIRKYWGEVVRRGSPTIPESVVYGYGREAFSETGSLCHGFTTSPAIFFREILLGIHATKPGYAEFRFAPQPLDLTFASGSVITPKGKITIRWDKQDGQLLVDLQFPTGLCCSLPDGRTLTESAQFTLPLP